MANRFLSNIKINDAYTFPASDGTNGQFIATDGAGNLSFQSAGEAGATVIYKDLFTGNASTVVFTLANSVDNEVKTQVYFDGVYQSKENYTVSGSEITFSTAPPSGAAIEVITFATVAAADYNQKLNFYGKAIGTIAKGEAVMFAGAEGDHFLITKATQAALDANHEYFLGLAAHDFANNQYGYVTQFGRLEAMDTSDYIAGDILWFDSAGTVAGALTTTAPSPPNTKIQIAAVVRVHQNEGVIFVRPTVYHEISELHDVSITNAADKDLLSWNATSGVWENTKTLGNITTGNITTSGTVDGVDVSLFKSDYDTHNHDGRYYTELEVDGFLANKNNWDTAYGWGDHSTQSYATQTYVGNAIAGLIDSAPATLDTLNELAAALGDDPNFATTVSNSIGLKWTQDNVKISNWDTAYSWGNHAGLYSLLGHTHDDRYYTETESDARFAAISHTHSYLPLAGGTLTGALNLASNLYYEGTGNYALGLNNSDIIGLNSLYFNDNAENSGEGINFTNDATGNWSTLRASNGILYFAPNRANTAASDGSIVLHSTNFTNYTDPKYLRSDIETRGVGLTIAPTTTNGNGKIRTLFNGGSPALEFSDNAGTIDADQFFAIGANDAYIGKFEIRFKSTGFGAAWNEEGTLLAEFKADNNSVGFPQGRVGIGTDNYGTNAAKLLVGPYIDSGSSAIAQFDGFLRIKDQIIIHDPNTTTAQGILAYTSAYGMYYSGSGGGNNFGIGTTTPSQRLSVEGGSIKLNHDNTAADYYLWLNKKSGQDGGVLLSKDNTFDWQINNTTVGDLHFYSYGKGDTAVAFKRSNGYVGIGRTNQSYVLDVYGGTDDTARFVAGFGDALVRIIGGNYATETDARLFLGENDTLGMTFEYDGVQNYGHIGMNDSVDPTGAFSKRISFPRDGSFTLFNAGNVGIGTTSPEAKLEVNGNIGFTGDTTKYLFMPGTYQGTGSIYMQAGFGSAQAGGAVRLHGHNATTYAGGDVEVGLSGKGDFMVNTYISGSRLFTVKQGGFVGIGTDSPAQKLHVNGLSAGLNFTGGNNRIYFNNYRAIEGAQDGSILQVGEGYTSILLQSSNVGINATSPIRKLHVGGNYFLSGSAASYISYTPDGLFNSNAFYSFLGSAGYSGTYGRFGSGGGLILGYQDNGSGLYSPAYGFEVKSIDGANNANRVVRAIVMKDVDTNEEPFWVNNNGSAYFKNRVGLGTGSPSGILQINGTHPGGYGLLRLAGTTATIIDMDGQDTWDVRLRYKRNGTDYWFLGMFDSATFRLTDANNGTKFAMSIDGTAYMSNRLGIATTNFGTAEAKFLVGDYLSNGSSAIAQFNGFLRIKDQLIIHNASNTALEGNIQCTANLELSTNSTFRAAGDVIAYYSSDKQLKNNITPITNAINKVKAIGGYEFDWNDKQEIYKGHDVGVIAQEIEAVLPEIVTTRENGYKAVKYEKIVPLLIEAIKELSNKVEELENKLNGNN